MVCSMLSISVSAQESVIGDINYQLLQKYIELARTHFPRTKIFEARMESAKQAIPMNTMSYLDLFNASYFYRPDKGDVLNPVNPYTVNGFQFGISFNLGTYLQKPFMGKKAKAEYRIAQYEAEEYNLTLATEVKRRYYAYIEQVGQLKVYTQSVQDNKNVAEDLKYKFEKGEVSLETFNQSRINYATANTSKITAEVAYLSAKDLLEEIIGKPLSEVK